MSEQVASSLIVGYAKCFYLSFHLQFSQFCHHFPSDCKTQVKSGV